MQEILTGHVSTDKNLAHLLTKVVSVGTKRQNFIRMYLYDIADNELMYSSNALFAGLEVPLLFAKYSTKGHSMHIVFLF